MSIFSKVENIKTTKEELRAALNQANVITPPLFPLAGYERQIRKVPDEQLPNFFYTLDDKANVERVEIIFDKDVKYYNIWPEKGSSTVVYPKFKLIYKGSLDLNLAARLTTWGGDTLEYLEANNEELIYTGSNPYAFAAKVFKFPKLKVFSFGRNFAENAIFGPECFPHLVEFNGNVCQNDTTPKTNIILNDLEKFNGSLCPNAITEEVFCNKCTEFKGTLAKGRIYHFENLGTISHGFLANNNIVSKCYMGNISKIDTPSPFAGVNKETFTLYVKRGSNETLINQLTTAGIQVMYYA